MRPLNKARLPQKSLKCITDNLQRQKHHVSKEMLVFFTKGQKKLSDNRH